MTWLNKSRPPAAPPNAKRAPLCEGPMRVCSVAAWWHVCRTVCRKGCTWRGQLFTQTQSMSLARVGDAMHIQLA